jgi:hypothetical protein
MPAACVDESQLPRQHQLLSQDAITLGDLSFRLRSSPDACGFLTPVHVALTVALGTSAFRCAGAYVPFRICAPLHAYANNDAISETQCTSLERTIDTSNDRQVFFSLPLNNFEHHPMTATT